MQSWFIPGQQKSLFLIPGFAVIGLIALNIISALRQKLPIKKLAASPFSDVTKKNKVETIIGVVLYVILVLGFFVVVIDTQVNGNQIVDMK